MTASQMQKPIYKLLLLGSAGLSILSLPLLVIVRPGLCCPGAEGQMSTLQSAHTGSV